ncbi:MAG: TorF family putative porin [Xanthomonadaceae bacterium]|nr:TorF family putative porin [Xanthomonadaceae bacterium]
MKIHSRALIASTMLAAAGLAQADVTANVATVSNYLFRGVSQTDDGAAVQGGFDYSNDSGAYLGTWLSNIDFGGKEDAELDLYGGFGGDFGDSGVSYDIGAIYYLYPGGGDLDYAEVYGGVTVGAITASIAYTVWGEVKGDAAFDTGDIHYGLSADLPVSLEGFSATLFAGFYDFDEDGNVAAGDDLSYAHWGIGIAKDLGDFGSFGLTYEQTNGGDTDAIATDDNPNFWISWSKEF